MAEPEKIKPTRQISRNTIEAHTRIVDLLEAGDLEGCKRENKKHITDVRDRLMRKYSGDSGSEDLNSFLTTTRGGSK